MELNPTAYVILGMVSREPRSGYEIKALVDDTTRFFWAASYGQIYPELKRLSEAGLVEGVDAPRGDRKRTVYAITADGESELKDWLRLPPSTYEMREEGLLKLFFAGVLPREEATEILRSMREHRLGLAERLRKMEPKALAKEDPFPLIVLRGGSSSTSGSPTGASEWSASSSSPPARKGAADVRRPRPPRQRQRPPYRHLRDRFFVLAGALGGGVAKRLDPYGADDPATETVKAREQLENAGLRAPAVIAVVKNTPVAAPASRARVEALENEVRKRADVKSVTGYYDTRSPVFVSHDRQSTYFAVALEPTGDKQVQEAGGDVADLLSSHPEVVVGGFAVAQEQVNKQVEKDLQMAEMLAFPLLFLLSLLFFRSLVAALLPLLVGGLAIVGTFLILRIASELGSISIFALNLTTAIGLGLAIDYSLFVVSRYREEIAKDGPGLAAMRRVMSTAGRTVFFSSLTVAAALASLLVFPQRFLYSMGLGGSLAALLAATVSLTVLPAVLTLLGTRVNSLAPRFLQRRAEADTRPDENGFWYRLSRFVMRRPVPVATLSALLLIVMGIPFFGIKFNTVDPTVLPKSASARQAYDTVSNEFPPYHETPIWVDLEGGGPKAAALMAARVRQVGGVAEVAPPQPLRRERHRDPDHLRQRVRHRCEPGNGEADTRPADAAGNDRSRWAAPPRDFIDFQGSLAQHLPIALGIVILATLVILFLMTGSVILPIKSLIMNFLNLSAVFGLLVLIFQDGRFENLLSYTSPGAIEQTHADPALRGRLRPLHRLRGLPPLDGSRRRATTAPRTPSAWRSGWSERAGSSPPRRCCSRS